MEMFEIMQETMPEFFSGAGNSNNSNGSSDTSAQNAPFGVNFSELSEMMDMIREFQNGSA